MAEVSSAEIQKYSTLVKLQPDNPEAHFSLGLAYEEGNSTAEAVKAYELALKLNPRHSRSYLHRGFHYAKNGELDHALADWSRAFDYDQNLALKFSSDPDTQARYRQKIDSALQQFERPIVINPKNAFAHYQLGTAQKFFNRLELSIQSLKRALDINPKLWEAHHQCGEIYAKLDQCKLAISNFKKAVDANPKFADSHYQLAMVYERESMSGMAAKHLEEAIRLDPEAGRFYFAYGKVFMKQTKYKNAMLQFQRALDLDPVNPAVHLHLAECCKEMYRPDLALRCYEKAVELDPASGKAISELGTIALQLGEIDKAIKSFEKAIELNPEDPYAHYHIAQAYQRKNDFRNAETHYSQAVALSPKDAFAAYNLGLVREELGNLMGAVEAYKRAVELKSQDAQYHLMLAKACLKLGATNEAITALQAANRQNPNDLETNFLLADVMMKTGQIDEAISMYRRVTELNPESVDAHNRLAEAFYRLEMFDYAFDSYQQALRLNSKHVPSLHGMGQLYLRHRNKPSIAVDFFQQALELDPTHAPSVASLGEAYVALNQPERALQFFERKLEENRENPSYLSKYAEALSLAGQSQKAIEELRRALQLDPENTLIRKTLGRLYMQERKFTDALDQWVRLSQQNPNEVEFYYQQGCAYEELNQDEKAKVAYNEVLVRRPDHREAMQRLELLYGEDSSTRPRPSAMAPAPTPSRPMESSDTAVDAILRESKAAPPPPVQVAPAHDDLESLLNMSQSDFAPPPPPPVVATPPPVPVAPPAPKAVDDLSAEDLLASLMGGGSDGFDAGPPPPPPTLGMESMPPPPVAEAPTPPPPPPPVVAEPKAVATPVAPVAVTPSPAQVPESEEDDIGGFLRDLGYNAEEETPPAPVAVAPPPPVPVPEPPAPEPPKAEPVAEAAPVIDVQSLLQKAVLAQVMGNPDEAESAYQQIIQGNPTHYQTYLLYGQFARTVRGDNNKATALFSGGLQFASLAQDHTSVKQFEQELSLLRSGESMPAVPEAEAPAPPPEVEAPAPPPVVEAEVEVPAPPPVVEAEVEVPAPPPVEEAAVEVPAPPPVVEAEIEVPAPPPVEEAEVEMPAPPPVEEAEVEMPTPPPAVEAEIEVPAPPPVEEAEVEMPTPPPAVEAEIEVPAPPPVEEAEVEMPVPPPDVEVPAPPPVEAEAEVPVPPPTPEPSAFELLLAQAREAIQQGQFDEAQGFAKGLVQEQPDHAEALALLQAAFLSGAEQRHQAGNHQDALKSLSELKELAPASATMADEEALKVYQKWAESFEEQNQFEQAIGIYHLQVNQGLHVDRAHEEIARAFGAWAEHLETSGNLVGAVDVYQKLLQEQPAHEVAPAEISRLLKAHSQKLVEKGDYESAIGALQQAQAAGAGDLTADIHKLYSDWAQAHLDAKEFEPAILVYTQAGDEFKAQLPQAFLKWAAHHEGEGDYEQGIDCLHRHKRDHGGDPEVDRLIIAYYRDWGKYLKEDGHGEAAQDVMQRLKNEYPDEVIEEADPSAPFRAGVQECESKKDFAGALKAVAEWLSAQPDSAQAASDKLRLSQLHLDSLSGESAVAFLAALAGEEATQEMARAQTPAVYAAWSNALANEGDFEPAVEKARAWLATGIEPDKACARIAELQSEWAAGLLEAGHAEAAARIYEQVTLLEGSWEGHEAARETAKQQFMVASLRQAEELEKSAGAESALAFYRQLAERDASHAQLQEHITRLEAALAPPPPPPVEEPPAPVVEEAPAPVAEEAAPTPPPAQEAEAVDPGLAEAIAKGESGDVEGAEAYIRDRLLQEPENKACHDALYRLFGSGDNSRRLVEFYRDIQKSSPSEPAFLLHLARAYCHTGKDTLAVVQFRKLVQTTPHADTYVDLAEAYIRLKKPQDALKSVQSALELDANHVPSLVTKVRIVASEDSAAAAEAVNTALAAATASPAVKAWLEEAKAALEGGGLSTELVERPLKF